MPIPRLRHLALFALLASATLAVRPAAADPSSAERETARTLMDEGDARRDKGDFAAALKSYEAADAIMHVPTTTIEVARMQAQLGRLLDARETLARLQRSPARPGDPAPFTAARKEADALVADLGVRLPTVTILVTNAEPGEATVVVLDDETVPAAAAKAPQKIDPGRHTVGVRSGAIEKTRDFEVVERESRTLTIDLSPQPSVEVATVGASAPRGRASALPAILVYGGFGLGAAGLGVGAVTGLMSLSRVDDLEQSCPNKVCPSAQQGDLDSAKSLGTISTVAFAAGAIGVGAGVVGLVLRARRPGAAPSSGATGAAFAVRPELGPRWAGVSGSF